MKLRNYLGVNWKDISKEEQETLLKKYWYETTTDATPTPATDDNGCILEFMDEADDDYLLSIAGFDNSTEDERIIEVDENATFYSSEG